MEVVVKEVAKAEVEKWLDYKKVGGTKRENFKDSIDTLAGFISDGSLTLKEDKTFEQALKFPIGSGGSITKLEYKPRIAMSVVNEKLKGVAATDADGRLLAYTAALTGQPKNIIKELDTEDNAVAQAVVVFFV
jgi:hypothetical protein